uniref:Uncharacterized protein n=1 Tax=Imasa heleensis TaxID=2772037 RepID=A0A893DD29_9EUKA|nr:hypothetical protein K8K73_mgp06 [Imasa heleensis]QRR29765.1 hypothetical protein [Imasa heleensis]
MNRLNYINDIYSTTTIKNAIDFNYKTHLRIENDSEKEIVLNTSYSEYPPKPSRRILDSRSSHYPFLSKIYHDLPSRIMFYIPRVEQKLLERNYSIKRMYARAYFCIYKYMKSHYNDFSNSIISKMELNPDQYHSKIKDYMPNYYYIYKATNFNKPYITHNTVNNYFHNNYTVMYILIVSLLVMYPMYYNMYCYNVIPLTNFSDLVSMLLNPGYMVFSINFIHLYNKFLYAFSQSPLYIEYIYYKLSYLLPISINTIYTDIVTYLAKLYSKYGLPSGYDARFWKKESSYILVLIYDTIYNMTYMLMTVIVYPTKMYFTSVINNALNLRIYYIIIPLLLFYSIFRHGSGGFNQVVKDYVSTRGYFYSYYAINVAVLYSLYIYISSSIYVDEPFSLWTFIWLDDYFYNVIYSIYNTVIDSLNGVVSTAAYKYFFRFVIHS